MKFGQILTSVYLAGCITLSGPAWGAIVVDTGAPQSFSDVLSVGYSGEYYGYFVSTVDTITGLQGYFNTGHPSAVIIASLYDDDGGAPGSLVGSGNLLTTIPTGYPLTGVTDLSISVEVGKGYWVGFKTAYLSGMLAFGRSAPNPLSAYGYLNYVSGTGFERRDDLNIALLVTGENAAVTGSVPEVSTWAMLLIGFGAMGTVIRRRRIDQAIGA